MFFKKKWFNNTYFPILIFLIVSSILIFSWFKEGHFYGGGDVGLPTYNPMRILQLARYIWWEAIAPGFLIPHTITSIILYFFLSFFQLLGIGPLGIQAVLFCALLFLMGFGMYLLTLSIIGQDKKIYAILAGLFYVFNPYMMTQIWHRFVHTSFLFVASIPFIILFWRLWIKSGNYLYLLYFLLLNLLASYMFGTLAFVFPLWLILSLFTLSEIFIPWENKSYFIKVLWRSIFGLVFWILFNSWWLIPVLTVSQGVASQQHNIEESLFTLVVISKQAILPFTLQMVNSYYIFGQAEFGEIYKSFFFRLIPWLGVVTIFYGIIYSLRKKHLVSLVLIYLVIIMLSKGISPPFGQPFLLLFSKFFAFGLLRNPFEKIGILLPLVSSILFVVGIEGFFSWSGKYLGNLSTKFVLVILLMIMGIYYWPMYQGKIFGRIDQPNYVEIPQSYQDADNWLSQRVKQDSKIDGKILHLPLTRSDIVTYKWEYGYHGVESSSSIFTSLPSISRGVSLQNTDDALTALSLIFHNPYNLHQDKILKLLQDFNVKFIILHKDIEWKGADIYDPQESEKVLDSLNFLERKIQYGDLVIYELLPQYFKSKVVLTNNINFASPNKANMRIWPYLIFENSNDIITPLNDSEDKLIDKSNEAIIFPSPTFFHLEASERQINQFNVYQKGEYELLMAYPRSRDVYPNKLDNLDFQINDKTISLQANERSDVISFGSINLNEGLQEISFKRLISENQFSALDQNIFQLSSNGIQPAYVDNQLTKIQGEETFLVTFDALIQSGTGFYVQIIQDTDSLQGDKRNPLIKVSVYRTSQDSNWQTYRVQLPSLNLTTRKAVFRLIVDPTGTTSFGNLIDNQPTIVSIKNVQVGRVLDNPIYLYSKSQTSIASTSAEITQLKEETPVLYTGKVRIDQPTFMIFKEAFNPGWELELKEDNEVYKADKHYLANLYGNGWWIDKIGEYDFKIEFEPQGKVTIGLYLAIFGGGVLISLIIFQKFKKYERN